MIDRAEGCGKTDVCLALYFVVPNGNAKAVPGTFDKLPRPRLSST